MRGVVFDSKSFEAVLKKSRLKPYTEEERKRCDENVERILKEKLATKGQEEKGDEKTCI